MHPASLPPGSIVGSWRLLGLASQGSSGVVFRVERTAHPQDRPLALKLALQPGDPRFTLEGELLSRIHHPHVPRLHDSGQWSGPGGALFPFLVMDWADGLPLYSWARLQPRSSREVMRVLTQAASALEAVHAAGGLHRDVRGDNLLVRPEDGQAVLVDFGACTFRGAPVLTRQSAPPGTPHYQSPQAQLHQWRFRRHPAARYEASAADDVYALGITAYRLTTGRYPLIADETGLDNGLEDDLSRFPELVPADALVQLSPELARWIRQMLSVQPEARGTPAELTVGMERSARTEGPEADRPVGPRRAPESNLAQAPSLSPHPAPPCWHAAAPLPPPPLRPWQLWFSVTTIGVLFVAVGGGLLHALLEASPAVGSREQAGVESAAERECDTSGLAELTLPQPLGAPEPVRKQRSVSAKMPAQPLPGQRLPPCQRPQFEINGGCWLLIGNDEPPCSEITYEWKRRCYSPALGLSRPLNTRER